MEEQEIYEDMDVDTAVGAIDGNEEPAIIKIYNAINEVMGGVNRNELFCLSMPGTIINPADYVYDTKYKKPIKVAANESRLVNKLYDPAKIVGSDNGRQLATQYKSAIDSLTPKINKTLIQAKNELRKMLMMQTSYVLDDGTTITMTFQQLFYKLYEEYVDEKKKWSELQNEKNEELLMKYPNDSDESKSKHQEEYLEWYQTVAESNLLKINMKHGKVSSLFSENDMKIIEGVLDSGVGSELQDAREQMTNARKFDPDGGYVYPVSLEPSDWFKSLDSGFSFIDLLKTSEHYAQKLSEAYKKRNSIADQIQMLELNDKSGEIEGLIKQLKESQNELALATKNLDNAYGKGFSTSVNVIMNIVKSKRKAGNITNEDKDQIAKDTRDHANKVNKEIPAELNVEEIIKQMGELDEAQRRMDDAAKNAVSYASRAILAKASDYSKDIKALYNNLKYAQEDVDTLKINLDTATLKEDGKLDEKLFPNAIEGRYTQVNVTANSSEMKQQSHEQSRAASESVGVNFLFGGYHSSSDEASATAMKSLDDEKFSLSVGFLATKVNVTRNWFNPGVFLLSEDMYHTSKNRVSLGDIHNETSSKCIFPCYPTAFVIAKDVSIKMEVSQSNMKSMKSMMERHSSKGGGFLCFRTNSSSSDSMSDSSLVSTSSGNSIIVKIPGPQVIGYYLQSTPLDKSEAYTKDVAELEMDKMITDFVTSYREILAEKQ